MDNYFNYFTKIEECFQRARETPSLLSTLDWALIESWKDAGIPLEAVLAGIEATFEKHRKRPKRFQKVNGLAYCAQEVMRAADDASASQVYQNRNSEASQGLADERVHAFLAQNAELLRLVSNSTRSAGDAVLAADCDEVANALESVSRSEAIGLNLEELDQRMTALEEKLTASLTRAANVELLTEFRQEIDRALTPYRRNLQGAEIESLGRQFIKRRLFEHYRIPRLSIFYMLG